MNRRQIRKIFAVAAELEDAINGRATIRSAHPLKLVRVERDGTHVYVQEPEESIGALLRARLKRQP